MGMTIYAKISRGAKIGDGYCHLNSRHELAVATRSPLHKSLGTLEKFTLAMVFRNTQRAEVR
jgi:hypothetical protein